MAKELENICDELKREMKLDLEIFKKMKERAFRKERGEINASLAFLNKMFECVTNEVKQIKEKQNELRAENANLLPQYQDLRNQASNCLSRILLCEQYSININIEMKGVLGLPNEKLIGLLEKLGQLTG